MKNFKALALTALTIAATLAPAAQAQVADRVVTPARVPASHRNLAQAINDAGVTIYDGRNTKECRANEEGRLMGYYQGHANYMVLCTNNGTMAEMLKTLTHEAVHMFQDCHTGGINSNGVQPTGEWKKLISRLSDKHVNEIQAFYPEHKWGHEVEARAFENSPNQVASGIGAFCF